MSEVAPQPTKPNSQLEEALRACVHCGLCLEECPTYRLTGDENNSPRGRLFLWRALSEGSLQADKDTDFYTDECVGCLACESACPANVPYGEILESTRAEQVKVGRAKIDWKVSLAGHAVKSPRLFNLALAPARILRKINFLPHPMVFKGVPAWLQSTASYTKQLMAEKQPTGPTVAFLTGCLMEAMFREINFATVRVLIENNVQVLIPESQGCCGAFHEHTGMPGAEELFAQNRQAFRGIQVDRVVTNSAGCGFALSKALKGEPKVQDVLGYLGELGPIARPARGKRQKVYVDLPCHLVHGQKVDGIPANVLDATGYEWELAPCAKDCCGSGGVYNIQKPDNARAILKTKSDFLNSVPASCEPILATANHVCMMQWKTAHSLVKRPFQVKHVIQLLDPEA